MTVQAVSRALKILSLFSAAKPTLKISEISELMALPNTTVHGLVKTLCQEGFLSRDPRTRQYSMGLKVVELGTQLASTLRINQMGSDLIQLLSISTGQSARIAIWNDDSMLITLNTFPSVQYIQYQPVGPRIPSYCSALGKSVLSTFSKSSLEEYLSRIILQPYTPNTITDKKQWVEQICIARERGYAMEKSELLMGVNCIAVPVFDQTGIGVASVSLSGTVESILGDNKEKCVNLLIQAGLELSRRMGFRPESM